MCDYEIDESVVYTITLSDTSERVVLSKGQAYGPSKVTMLAYEELPDYVLELMAVLDIKVIPESGVVVPLDRPRQGNDRPTYATISEAFIQGEAAISVRVYEDGTSQRIYFVYGRETV